MDEAKAGRLEAPSRVRRHRLGPSLQCTDGGQRAAFAPAATKVSTGRLRWSLSNHTLVRYPRTFMTNLLYLIAAIALSMAGSAYVLLRNRRPHTLESGIEEFSRELQALAPEEQGPMHVRRSRQEKSAG